MSDVNSVAGVFLVGSGPASAAEAPRSRRPVWIASEGHSSPPDRAQEIWRSLCETNPGSVFVLPQVACLPHESDADPWIHATWQGNGTLRSLGVLSARKMKLDVLPRVSIALSARRLVGCQLIGDESPESIAAFVDTTAGILRRHECDCVVLQDVDAASPLRQAFREAPRRHSVICGVPIEPRVHRWIRFPEKPADYWSQFSKKTRYNFRWRAKHLEHRVECIENPRDVAQYTKIVSDFNRSTWQYKQLGFTIDPVLKGQLWTELAKLGAFRSYLLWQGDKVIAYAVGLQWKGLYRYEETGYDPALAAKSPGQVLLYRLIEDLIARDTPQLLDFGSGDNEYKRIYSNHETLSGPIMLAHRSARTVCALVGNRVSNSVGKRVRWALSQLGALSRLRHLRRGHAAVQSDEEGV